MHNRTGVGRKALFYAVVLLAGIASLYLFFHRQIDTGFAFIFGDEYDAAIEAALVSHWDHVLALAQPWREPPYFFPHRDVLGYNDGYVLYGLIGAVYRALGFNIFQAQAFVHVTVKAVGFVSMVLLLNQIQGRHVINILGAALFTLAINSSVQAVHGQTLAMAVAPLLTLLLLGLTRAVVARAPTATMSYGLAFVLLFNSLLMTAFYAAWFFGLFAISFFAAYAILARAVAVDFFRAMLALKREVAILAIWFISTVVPFLYVYLPKLRQTGGQTYSSQLAYSLNLVDIFNYGPGSLVWGWLARWIESVAPNQFHFGEHRVGFTPDVLLVLALAIAACVARNREVSEWMKALALACLIGLTLPVAVGHYSLWFLVQLLVPGASGARTISRYYIFLSFPVSLLISLYLADLGRRSHAGMAAGILVMLLVCASQINRDPPVNLDVAREMAIIDGVGAPPAGCISFVVSNPQPPPSSQTDRLYRQNVQAMLVADKLNMPTLNGFATFNPPDWIFTQDDGYLRRVVDFVRRHGLTGVCRYDLSEKKWYTDVSAGG
jgi:hypothetical protein